MFQKKRKIVRRMKKAVCISWLNTTKMHFKCRANLTIQYPWNEWSETHFQLSFDIFVFEAIYSFMIWMNQSQSHTHTHTEQKSTWLRSTQRKIICIHFAATAVVIVIILLTISPSLFQILSRFPEIYECVWVCFGIYFHEWNFIVFKPLLAHAPHQ